MTTKKIDPIKIPSIKIDSIPHLTSIDILQMDIEGAEEEAIYGAQNLIDNSPNLIVFQEWSPFWIKDMDKYLKFWRSRGFKIAKISGKFLQLLTDEDLKSNKDINHSQIDIIMAKDLEYIITNFKQSL